ASRIAASLSRLTVHMTEGATMQGVEVKRDGVPLKPAELGSPAPLEPGTHVVEALAPGHRTWSARVVIASSGNVEVAIPPLELVAPGEENVLPVEIKPVEPESGSSQRTIGALVAGGGLGRGGRARGRTRHCGAGAAGMTSLTTLVGERRIVLCCGPGGVGKTSLAAATALEGARQGRRACVVTIDPARRLADALGLGELTNTPGRIAGDWPGELWAVMLDPRSTFDELVRRYARTTEQAEAILGNALYRNIAGALSGTQEYMATEKLYELHEEGRFDLIVVDTPPTRNALEFLDAPRRLTRFLDNRVFRLVVMPSRAYLRAVSVATQAFLRTVSKVVGSEVISDAVAFFQAFEGMEEGFRDRARSVDELLHSSSAAFVLVTTARRDAVEEGLFFAGRLIDYGFRVEALVVNRLHPRFGAGPAPAGADRERARSLEGTPLGPFFANLADFRQVAEREEAHFAALAEQVAPAPVVRVPFLAGDVHDLAGLAELNRSMFPDNFPGVSKVG
ncbi:MAG: ArsA family ATPase, partial [Acidimicrobiales bacterium]